jgi:hypothetical protein
MHTVLGFRTYLQGHDTRYTFERHDQKLVIFVFLGHFVSYCQLFWGSMEIYKEYDSLYILERNHKKLVIFAFMAIL